MNGRTALRAGALGVGIAAVVLVLPDAVRLAALAAAAAVLFVLYAVRERNALRALGRTLRGLVTSEESQRAAQAQAKALDQQSRLLTSQGRLLREQVEVNRAQAVALATMLDRMKEQSGAAEASAASLRDAVAASWSPVLARLDQLYGRLAPMSDAVDHRFDGVNDRFDAVNRRFDAVDGRLGHAATQTEMRRLHTAALAAAGRDFQQVEALVGLHSLFRVRAPLPQSRGWAAAPDVLLQLVWLVFERRPRLVVELGSGLSTIWLSYALESVGEGGRVVSVDHELRFGDITRALVAAHGLEQTADVRHAPLKEIELDGETWPWYDLAAFADVTDCELLVVDGPPAATRDRARYPALPLLGNKLAERATVVVDDLVRQDEKDIVSQWCERDAGWQVEILGHEKGTAVLSRSPGGVDRPNAAK